MVALLLAGCAAQSPGPLEVEVPDAEPTEQTPVAEGFSVAQMLREMPPVVEASRVIAADVTTAAEIAGAPVPTELGDPLLEWLMGLSGVRAEHPVSVPWPDSLGVMTGAAGDGRYLEAVGFDARQVQAFLEVGAPPTRVLLAEGDFDPAAVTTALGEPESGIWRQPGAELVPDRDGLRAPDLLGRPVSLAADSDRVLMSLEAAHVADYLAGSTGEWGALMTLAEAIDTVGVYAAFLWRGGEGEHIGVGLTAEGETVAVRVFDDPDAAAAAAETLPGTADGPFTVREATAEGSLLVVHLDREGAGPAAAWNLLSGRSPVLG